MKGLNGLDAAHTVRKMDGEVAIVFVTNMKQLAIKGYDVGALDFIVKPIDYGSFEMKMKRVMNYAAIKMCVSWYRNTIWALCCARPIVSSYCSPIFEKYLSTNATSMSEHSFSSSTTAILTIIFFFLCFGCALLSLYSIITHRDALVYDKARNVFPATRNAERSEKSTQADNGLCAPIVDFVVFQLSAHATSAAAPMMPASFLSVAVCSPT